MIGEKLGYPAHMSNLTRTEAGGFSKEQCATFQEIEKAVETGIKESLLFPLEAGIRHLPKWEISDTLAEKVKNGAVLKKPETWPETGDRLAVFFRGKMLAVYVAYPGRPGFIKPAKVL
jgi:tRNA pseudouridine55 synthase